MVGSHVLKQLIEELMNLGKRFSKDFDAVLSVFLQTGHVFYSISKEDQGEVVSLHRILFIHGNLIRVHGTDRELEEGLQSDQTSQCIGLSTSCTWGHPSRLRFNRSNSECGIMIAGRPNQ